MSSSPQPVPDSEWTVPFDGGFVAGDAAAEPPEGAPGKKEAKRALADEVDRIRELQKKPYADDRYALLLSKHDLSARARWDDYMSAREALLNETSAPHAPWFAIPADDEPFVRLAVARIAADTLEALPLAWPEKSAAEIARFDDHVAALEVEGD